MMVNFQLPEVSRLLWDMFGDLDAAAQGKYARRVDSASRLLFHPNLGEAVVHTVGGDNTPEPTVALGRVVPPVEGT